MRPVDPHAVLGIAPGADAEAIQRAWRELAKRHHPDRAGSAGGELMASINAAYDMLRDSLGGGGPPPPASPPPPGTAGAWLPDGVRRVLARELLAVLQTGEQVDEIVLTATSDSHEVQLALTDRRLLWLRDDAIVGRVRYLRYPDLASFRARPARGLRRRGELRVESASGRRIRFFDLRPEVLLRLVELLAGRVAQA